MNPCYGKLGKVDKRRRNMNRLFHIIFFSVLLSLSIFSQFNSKEKLEGQISELKPSYSIQKNFKNLEIIGFDVLDGEETVLTSKKFSFLRGSDFYVVLYGRRKIFRSESPTANFLPECKAVMEYQNGGVFWSRKTTYSWRSQRGACVPKEWQIGGVYKMKFAFRVPSLAFPGKYRLKIFGEEVSNPVLNSIIALDEIKINVNRTTSLKDNNITKYNLPLHGCLLNPAFIGREALYFLWTGNVEYYLDESFKNFSKIIVSAKGTPADGVYPLLKIYVGQKEIGNTYVNDRWMEYKFDLKLIQEGNILKIRFDNDYKKQGQDRNMYVRKIELMK